MQILIITTLLGTMFTQLIGWFWYQSILFGDVWLPAANLNALQQPKDISFNLILELISRFIRSVCFMNLYNVLLIQSFWQSIQLALFLSVGFIFPQILTRLAWEQKTIYYFFIQASEQVISMLVLTLIAYFIS